MLDLRKIAVQLLQQEQQNRCGLPLLLSPSLSLLSLSSSHMFLKFAGLKRTSVSTIYFFLESIRSRLKNALLLAPPPLFPPPI